MMAVWDCSSVSAQSCISVPGKTRAEDTGLAQELSHHERPRPGRRRTNFRSSALFLTLLLLSLLCGRAAAATPGDRRRSALARLAIKEELLFDRSEPPTPHMHLVRRQTSNSSRSSTSSVALTTILAPSGTSAAASVPSTASTTSLSVETSVASSSSLPQPFDTNLGNNFTNPNCPTFFSKFLTNETFQSCLPFSLLLQTSNSFFSASKSLVRVTQTLDATCNVNFKTCNDLMNSLAQQLRSDSNCGQDFLNRNPVVLQAWNGFIAYQPLYQAGCLRDSRGSYCFANAVTNASASSDVYPFYLPLGVAMAGGSRLTCNTCLQNTMAVFASAATNQTQPVSQTYNAAAQQINMGCGPNFVNTTIAVRSSAARDLAAGAGFAPLLALIITLSMLFI